MTEKNNVNKKSPADYAENSILAKEVGAHLITNLDWMTLQPKTIVDLGCGVGRCTELLKQRYPTASVIGVDCSEEKLEFARQNQSSEINWIRARPESIPIPAATVDLVYMNLSLSWVDNLRLVFRECHRILHPEGLLLFSSFGPDTLIELHKDLRNAILPILIDMHDIGDELVQADFADPVLNVEHITVTYKDLNKLLHELKVTELVDETINTVTLKKNKDDLYAISYEIVYAHAWKEPEKFRQNDEKSESEIKVPLSQLMESIKRSKN